MSRPRRCALLLMTGLALAATPGGWRSAQAQGVSAGFAPGAVTADADPAPTVPPIRSFFNPGAAAPPPGPTNWSPIQAGQGGGPGHHPDRTAWPGVSFFDFDFQQHINEGGLWFFEQKPWDRHYFANVSAFSARVRQPDDRIVGDQAVAIEIPSFGANGAPFAVITTGALFNSVPADLAGNPTISNPALVGEQHADPNHPEEWGAVLQWGWTEPGDYGVDFGGYYAPEAHMFFRRGLNPDLPIVDANVLAVTAAVSFATGGDTGVTVPYDRLFRIDFLSESAGAHAAVVFTPLLRRDWIKLQPVAGMRYQWIGEKFEFNGADSGGFYSIDTLTGLGIPGTFIPGVTPYSTQISSSVDSHLIGPEIGLQLLMGGKNLRITGRVTAGLAANFEELKLSGFGVGDPFTNPGFEQSRSFGEERDHLRLSPFGAGEINAEMRIFALIPLLRKVDVIERATFRLGYHVYAAGEVHRPHQTIEYNAQPFSPVIREDDRARWYVSGYTLGLHWDY